MRPYGPFLDPNLLPTWTFSLVSQSLVTDIPLTKCI